MNQTIKKLTQAYIGECQARNRYTMFAKIAKKEGYEQISAIFLETAEQELEHAKWFYRMINDLKIKCEMECEEIVVEASVPNFLGKTFENLKHAVNGEFHEHDEMYPDIVKTAKEENHIEVVNRVLGIIEAEKHHEERYKKLLVELESKKLFNKDKSEDWICRKCGYAHNGKNAPEICPSCGHPQGYFQINTERY